MEFKYQLWENAETCNPSPYLIQGRSGDCLKLPQNSKHKLAFKGVKYMRVVVNEDYRGWQGANWFGTLDKTEAI